MSFCRGVIPPKIHQQAIAHILGTLDDKIELNRRMNETLESMARAMFKAWFVDFEGHTEFEDSELGPIPKGWRAGKLSELAELKTVTVKPFEQPEVVWEHYSIPAFDDGMGPRQEFGSEIKSNKYQVNPGCILVSKLNPQFPRIWAPDIQDKSVAVCSTEFMPFCPVQAKSSAYILELLRSDYVQDLIKSKATGSTGSRQRVKPREIKEIPVVIPKIKHIEGFQDIIGPLHRKMTTNDRSSKSLSEIRDLLLPKLISGEIRATAAEENIKEVN